VKIIDETIVPCGLEIKSRHASTSYKTDKNIANKVGKHDIVPVEEILDFVPETKSVDRLLTMHSCMTSIQPLSYSVIRKVLLFEV
jgi:hypothetical protein